MAETNLYIYRDHSASDLERKEYSVSDLVLIKEYLYVPLMSQGRCLKFYTLFRDSYFHNNDMTFYDINKANTLLELIDLAIQRRFYDDRFIGAVYRLMDFIKEEYQKNNINNANDTEDE